ncbi:MAG: leucine-rich repeat domain-containing protein [Spirochaetaceae bacterium]|nr:leucine-rich repeat domain-containing protein [Spirochaetaceae bacterium]
MSAVLGYYSIAFLKKNGVPDVETAQRAFEWCQDEYDWFDEVDITLEDHCITGDELYVKYTDIPHEEDSIEEWIQDIGDEVGAELILADVTIDKSDTYSNGDGNFQYDLVYENGEVETESYEVNERLHGIVVGYDEYLVTDDDNNYSGKIYRGLFRNKKTGEEMNLGYLLIDDSGFYRFWRDDELDGAPAAYVCNDEGETVEAPNEDIYNYSCFGIEDDEGSVSNVTPCEVLSSWQIKTDSDEILDVSEWEFVGFNACERYDLLDRTRARVRTPTVVVIPEGTTTIGDGAYSGCTHISSIEIPSSVTSIGERAFRDCTGLTSVTIPSSVTSIGSSAFWGCTGLTSVTILDGVISIGSHAFRGCEGLTSVTIPDSVTSIGERAFYGCEGLTSIIIPNSVTSIGERTFADCTGLTSVTIPDSVTRIGKNAFEGCEGLTSVTIPDGVTSIGEGAFAGCEGLTSVTIPDSVTEIGSSAFEGCKGLTSVTIPDSVTSIGEYAF